MAGARRTSSPRSNSSWASSWLTAGTGVVNGKPAPDLFLHAASTLGTSPGRCAVVEDSAYGVQAARAAGMHVFAYAGGVTPAVLSQRVSPGLRNFRTFETGPGVSGRTPGESWRRQVKGGENPSGSGRPC
ncbi:HAD family phosphatase [Arthrobacter sp. UYEF3]|uniref:HAD family hydrolase n=1 Tax=Arthrobacter sp. UYEF3 TaxID=1756365 RepID=UPI0033992AC2